MSLQTPDLASVVHEDPKLLPDSGGEFVVPNRPVVGNLTMNLTGMEVHVRFLSRWLGLGEILEEAVALPLMGRCS